jgi:hypothetical protein
LDGSRKTKLTAHHTGFRRPESTKARLCFDVELAVAPGLGENQAGWMPRKRTASEKASGFRTDLSPTSIFVCGIESEIN